MAKLIDLPTELLVQVFESLEDFQSVNSLALTSQLLRNIWTSSTTRIFNAVLPQIIEHYDLASELMRLQMKSRFSDTATEQIMVGSEGSRNHAALCPNQSRNYQATLALTRKVLAMFRANEKTAMSACADLEHSVWFKSLPGGYLGIWRSPFLETLYQTRDREYSANETFQHENHFQITRSPFLETFYQTITFAYTAKGTPNITRLDKLTTLQFVRMVELNNWLHWLSFSIPGIVKDHIQIFRNPLLRLVLDPAVWEKPAKWLNELHVELSNLPDFPGPPRRVISPRSIPQVTYLCRRSFVPSDLLLAKLLPLLPRKNGAPI